MPQVPVTSPLGYVGVSLLLVGFFLILAGLGIVKVKQVTVEQGLKTWGVGGFLVAIGIGFLLPEISMTLPQAGTPTPTVAVAEAKPAETVQQSEPTPTEKPVTPTELPSEDVTNTPKPPTSTSTPEPTNTPRPTSTPTLLPTPIPTPTPLAYGELLFEDNFDDNRYGWNLYTGVWIEGGNLHIFPSQDVDTYVAGTQLNFENFIYETMFTIVEGSNGSETNFGPGLFFRSSPGLKQFYQCGIHQSNSGYQCQKADTSVTPEKWDLFVWEDEASIDIKRDTHKITVVADGNNIQLWVDDKLIHNQLDSTYQNGTIGLGSGAGRHVTFDYVRVWALPQ